MKNVFKRVVNKIHSLINSKQEELLIKNVFNKSHSKKVLVSYIITPFTHGMSDKHTNLMECYMACEIFDDLGFIVDIINYNEFSNSILYEEYSVVYGFGESLERLFYWKDYGSKGLNIKKIVYATGCDTVFSNKVSLKRVFDFYKKEGLFCINSARVVNNTWRAQIMFSDAIIALGNDFVAHTYSSYNLHRIKSIRIFFKETFQLNIERDKDFKIARNNFIWWGSAGAIHKGLDLVIDVFEKNPDLNLFICGVYDEYPFSEYLKSKLELCSNIKNLGFVQMGSDMHKSLLLSCVGTILPSASEGGAPGVVNACSTAGLLPLITDSCGVDMPDEAKQFAVNGTNSESLQNVLLAIRRLDDNELVQISLKILNYFKNNHSVESYKIQLTSLIEEVILN